MVLYKWTCGKSRIVDAFIPLSNLRLNTLTCNGGRVYFSSAAPILYLDRGRSVIKFVDKGVLTVVDGARKGINVLSGFLHEDETAVPAQYCTSREIDGTPPKWIEQKIMSLGCSLCYPMASVVVPELFRITRNLENIRPLFTTAMLNAIGATRADSVERLMELFKEHFDLFGTSTEAGYVMPNEYVAVGGLCVASSKGICMKSGSAVHSIPLSLFKESMEAKKWEIYTGEPNELERTN